MPAYDWERRESAPHADCRVYRILKERWLEKAEAGGREGEFFIIDVGDWAVALAKTPDDRYILVRQFRFGSGEMSLEFPAGVVDPGEDPVAAARRELYEESGYEGGEGRLLGTVEPNPALQRNRCHFVFFPEATYRDGGAPEGHESFDVVKMLLPEVRTNALHGGIRHAIVHAALLFLTP
ncbi:MAG: NUDIX domain-containing protein [Verrucomicrobia bacterium]|jgi:8-oxo-dGTP pyrophosphatase MutT (NUDIX family)|nr:NUDIX domain-containing protein [Verrucomicrobiota bacterium]